MLHSTSHTQQEGPRGVQHAGDAVQLRVAAAPDRREQQQSRSVAANQ